MTVPDHRSFKNDLFGLQESRLQRFTPTCGRKRRSSFVTRTSPYRLR